MSNDLGPVDLVPIERIAEKIYFMRGQKVMLDYDLAKLYQVPTKGLNQAVKRNISRFPGDFMFRLTREEAQAVDRSHFVTGSQKHRDPRILPYAFTEHGVAMLSSVLRSKRAVQMNILIVRAFIKLRDLLATHKDLARAIDDLRRKQEQHGGQITAIIDTINRLLVPEPVPPKRRIGFPAGQRENT